MKRPRIAFISYRDAERRQAPGHYGMLHALRRHVGEVSCLGPASPITLNLGRVSNRLLRLLCGKGLLPAQTTVAAKHFALIFEQRLRGQEFDFVFAPNGSSVLAYLDTKIPIIYQSDATLAVMRDYYPQFSDCFDWNLRQADEIDRRAIERADQVVVPSRWAANSVIKDYHAAAAKVHVVPLGANLDSPPTREVALSHQRNGVCKLLFLGISWERKGGPLAVETLRELRGLGVNAELTICGCNPRLATETNVTVIPYLSKDSARDANRMERLFQETDFLLFPTRAECFPGVCSEANAYGIPAIVTDTGGMPDQITDGVNGRVLPLTATAGDYVAVIKELLADDKRYRDLRRTSRDAFETRLNWDVWGRKMREILLGKEAN